MTLICLLLCRCNLLDGGGVLSNYEAIVLRAFDDRKVEHSSETYATITDCTAPSARPGKREVSA